MKKTVLTIMCAAAVSAAVAADAPRTFIGVIFAQGIGPDDNTVLLVDAVVAGSPAAGRLRPGDALMSVDGVSSADPEKFRDVIHAASPGDVLTFIVGTPHSGIRAVTVTVEERTPEREARLEALAAEGKHDLERYGVHRAVYLPLSLCFTGISFGEAFVLSVANGSVNLPLPDAEGCRQTVAPCTPVQLTEQSKTATMVQRLGRKYRLEGDWRRVTYTTADACKAGGPSEILPAPKGEQSAAAATQ